MRFSVCTDAVFAGMDTAKAIREVAALGLDAVEFWGWWDKDLPSVKRAIEETGVTLVGFCTRIISMIDPLMRAKFLAGLSESIDVALRMGTKQLIAQVGADMGEDRLLQRASIIECLQAAEPLLSQAGITLLVEPLNTRYDHAGYYLTSSEEGLLIVKAINSPSVRLLFDVYHQQISEGDISGNLLGNVSWVGHIHAAGYPGRHELDSGEIAYERLLPAIDLAGYSGYIGLEYIPAKPAAEGLRRILCG